MYEISENVPENLINPTPSLAVKILLFAPLITIPVASELIVIGVGVLFPPALDFPLNV